MDAALHRIEALPGSNRYAVTFRRLDGSEQTAAVRVATGGVEIAEASLPVGWKRESAVFRAVATAVLSFDAACLFMPAEGVLLDVEGGWDVSLGNVVLGADSRPACTAHGAMPYATATDAAIAATAADGEPARWECPDCGARARFGG